MANQVQDRLDAIQRRLNAVLSGLNISATSTTADSDLRIFNLLMNAADYAAIACDLSMTGTVLAQLVSEQPDGEAPNPDDELILVGIGLPSSCQGDALLSLVSDLPSLGHRHTHSHSGGCVSPDPSTFFPNDDRLESETPNQSEAGNTDRAPDKTTLDGKTEALARHYQELDAEVFVPSSQDPAAGAEEIANELLSRAEQLVTRAESLQSPAVDNSARQVNYAFHP